MKNLHTFISPVNQMDEYHTKLIKLQIENDLNYWNQFNIDETNIAAVASKKDLFEYLESLKYKIVVINGIKDTFLAIKSE